MPISGAHATTCQRPSSSETTRQVRRLGFCPTVSSAQPGRDLLVRQMLTDASGHLRLAADTPCGRHPALPREFSPTPRSSRVGGSLSKPPRAGGRCSASRQGASARSRFQQPLGGWWIEVASYVHPPSVDSRVVGYRLPQATVVSECWAVRSRARSTSRSSWPPTSLRRPASSSSVRASTP